MPPTLKPIKNEPFDLLKEHSMMLEGTFENFEVIFFPGKKMTRIMIYSATFEEEAGFIELSSDELNCIADHVAKIDSLRKVVEDE